MEPGSINNDIITRYLLKEASSQEARFVQDWVDADDENRLYVESLKDTLHLVSLPGEAANIDIDLEWEQFREVVFKEKPRLIHINQENIPDWEIPEDAKHNRRTKIFKILVGSVIAASVLFIVAYNKNWFSAGVDSDSNVTKREKVSAKRPGPEPLMAIVMHEMNSTGKVKKIVLPDGSEVALFTNSELTYQEPVNSSKRDIYLQGKAGFNVAKDKLKPFTVFSEEISTTAIGTEFTVNAGKKENLITVRLDEGKIVVRTSAGGSSGFSKSFYLVPGQELIYNRSTKKANVRSVVESKFNASRNTNKVQDILSIPNYGKGSWFMFNNQPLNEIFSTLSEMYKVKIVFAKKDLNNMYFIGTYYRSESLDNILKEIAALNNLKVIKENNGYRIKKF